MPYFATIICMSNFFSILTLINFFLLLYLLFLVLTKYRRVNNLSENAEKNVLSSFHKVKLFRFNPFDDVGGDQSFILILLNQQNDGILLTSLHHRNFTRLYAKPIKDGQGDNITLSKEEKSAILKAINH